MIKEADPVELERHDLIFFEDPQKYIKSILMNIAGAFFLDML